MVAADQMEGEWNASNATQPDGGTRAARCEQTGCGSRAALRVDDQFAIVPRAHAEAYFHLPDLEPAPPGRWAAEFDLGEGLFVTAADGDFDLLFDDVVDVAGVRVAL